MPSNPYVRRKIVDRVLRSGILVLLAFCFLAHSGSALTAGPFSRSVDLLAPPASLPDLIATAVQPLAVQDHLSVPWFTPETVPVLPPVAACGGVLLNTDFLQRPTAKAHITAVLPRPPPFSLIS